QKLERLVAEGIEPYVARFHRTHTAAEVLGALAADGRLDGVTLAGRLMNRRDSGGMSFGELRDGSGQIQLVAQRDQLGEEAFQRFVKLDPGDLIGVRGWGAPTRRGQPSVWLESFQLLSKSLRPLPEKWHGLKDVETRYRQRYVDLIANPEFTMFECYQAYADYEDMMTLTEEIIVAGATFAERPLLTTYQGRPLGFQRPFRRARMVELVQEATGRELAGSELAQAYEEHVE